MIQERVVMGMARARAQGKQMGRPRGTKVDMVRLKQLKADGRSLSQMGAAVNTSVRNVVRLLKVATH